MSAAQLLADLSARGVVLGADGPKLLIDAPSGALSDADVDLLRQSKVELLALLRGDGHAHVAAPKLDAVAMAQPEAIVNTPAKTLQPHGGPEVLPVESWDDLEEPGDPCPHCGSLAAWWPIAGDPRCLACDPPRRSLAVLERVERIRRRSEPASLQR